MMKVKKIDECRLDELVRDIYLNIEDWIPELLSLFNSQGNFKYVFSVLGFSNCLELNDQGVILRVNAEFAYSEKNLIENILLCKLEDFNIFLRE